MQYEFTKAEVLADYKMVRISRHLSEIGRREVLTGKATFGIFGDGKEVPQVAMAKFFRNGDWRSGYYRDQTFMFAIGAFTFEEFFAQIYGDTDPKMSPSNWSRSFNNHFATPNINPDGTWRELTAQPNTSADISPTAGQMPRLVGLAWASKIFREVPELQDPKFHKFSKNGDEVGFGMIGDSSTSEGHFWESMNAAGVLRIPMAVAVWDNGYGISVPKEFQTTKGSISQALAGMDYDPETRQGIKIYKARAWDYEALVHMFQEGIAFCRAEHVPVLFHVEEVTQPMGHSTSGSHERYKSAERLQWEKDYDANIKFREWILERGFATEEELQHIDKEAEDRAKLAKKVAYSNFVEPIKKERDQVVKIMDNTKTCMCATHGIDKVTMVKEDLKKIPTPTRKDIFSSVKKLMRHVCMDCPSRAAIHNSLSGWYVDNYEIAKRRYSSHLYNETPTSALLVEGVAAFYGDEPEKVPGREILRDAFDNIFANDPRVIAFGEDVGGIGGVNQTMENMQRKYGKVRVSDTGIREQTIMGQGIGAALRGLRPICEIQYLDYLLYALQTMSDDLATTTYRTAGQQVAPVIVSTRGHRLVGIWHSGSPMSMIINAARGMHICVPRNMTQAAGMYNTLMSADDPALVIEPLNGYRLYEERPKNLTEFRVKLGQPEILTHGNDITLVTYGSCVRIAQTAVEQLKEFNVNVELIDVQTLLPFDTDKMILQSIKKTNKVVFFDEDFQGGASAYMMQQVLEKQGAFYYLDAEPRTITGEDHRTAYGTDGDYFSNPNAENVFEVIYEMMHQWNPKKYPVIY